MEVLSYIVPFKVFHFHDVKEAHLLTIIFYFQGLAAFLKAIGYLIPLMDAEYANYYTREVMLILIREFQSPDEEMKKIVLKVRSFFNCKRIEARQNVLWKNC